jgi:hypothetical protein
VLFTHIKINQKIKVTKTKLNNVISAVIRPINLTYFLLKFIFYVVLEHLLYVLGVY